ncbi:hypothetical protein ES703_86280 [subsurface metagenome]
MSSLMGMFRQPVLPRTFTSSVRIYCFLIPASSLARIPVSTRRVSSALSLRVEAEERRRNISSGSRVGLSIFLGRVSSISSTGLVTL